MANRGWRARIGTLGRRRSAAFPLLIGAALAVAVAAGPAPSDENWTGVPDLSVPDWLLGGIVAVMAFLGLVLLIAGASPTKRKPQGQRRSIIPLLVLLGLIFLLSLRDQDPLESLEPAVLPPETSADSDGPSFSPPDPGPGLRPGEGMIILAIVAAAAGVAWWLRPAPSDDAELADEDDAGELEPALVRARNHLLDADDPRNAVLLAYHELETVFEAQGLGRQPSETPTEHLRRALATGTTPTLGADDERVRPLAELAELYSRARYAHHPIGPDDQRRAVEALERSLDLVRAP